MNVSKLLLDLIHHRSNLISKSKPTIYVKSLIQHRKCVYPFVYMYMDGVLGLTSCLMVEGCFCLVMRPHQVEYRKLNQGVDCHTLPVRAIQNLTSPGASQFLAKIQSLFSFSVSQIVPQNSSLGKYHYREPH